jgi:ribosomal protein S18 acetylase RimI-like enzyme
MIRPATVNDAHTLATVHIACWEETYTGLLPADYIAQHNLAKRLAIWTSILSKEHLVSVYEADGQVVGFVDGGRIRDDVPNYKGEIYALYLLKKYQGLGIGKALFNHMRKLLEANQFHPFTAWVLADNPSLLFYQKMGARIIGERLEEISGKMVKDIQLGWM